LAAAVAPQHAGHDHKLGSPEIGAGISDITAVAAAIAASAERQTMLVLPTR
jgi:hypothetical protein